MARPGVSTLVGRAAQWAVLAEAGARAAAGTTSVAVVRGEAGIGKTRLVADWAAAARAAGSVVALGRCIEVEGAALPLAPVAAVLRDLVRTLGVEAVRSAAGAHWPVLGLLVPELTDGVPSVARGRATHVETIDGFAQLARAVAARSPLVLVVEDVHWSDPLTRDLLGYLARTVEDAALLLVLTTRPEVPEAAAEFLAELLRLAVVDVVDLPRLEAAEVAELVGQLRGEAPSVPGLEPMVRLSDGIPFLVEELAASGNGAGLVPVVAGELLLRRWRSLGSAARQVVVAASLADAELTDGLLRAAVAGEVEGVGAALREAVDGGVLVGAPEREGYRFRHALLREAVADGLLPGESRGWHRRWAEALDGAPRALDPLTQSVASAQHWDAAGDAERALPACLAAADQCRLRAAYLEQSRLLQRALAWWDQAPVGMQVDRDRLVEDAFLSLLAAAAFAEVISLAEAELGRTLESDALRRAWLRMMIAELRANLPGALPDLPDLDQLLDVVTGAPPSLIRCWAANTAAFLLTRVDPERALAMAELAVATADALSDPDLSARLRGTRALAFVWLGQADRALREFEALLPDIDRVGPTMYGFVLVWRVSLNLDTGRLDAALAAVAEARRRLGDEQQAPYFWAVLTISHAQALADTGRWDEAQQVLEDARSRYSDADMPWFPAFRALMAVWRGDVEGASRAAAIRVTPGREAAAAFKGFGGWMRVAVGAARGDLRAVRAEVEAMQRKTDIRADPDALRLLLAAVSAEADEAARARALGDQAALEESERAVSALRSVLPAATLPGPGPDAQRVHIAAELDRWAGSTDPAPWQTVVDGYTPLGYPHERGWALLHLAEALVANDRRDQATDAATEAASIAEHLGARPLADEVASLARRARLSTSATAPDLPTQRTDAAVRLGLTDREREVLALLCEGLNNPAIAKQLFMSPKTASVHVSRILTKLGATNRTAAATAAHRLGLDQPPH